VKFRYVPMHQKVKFNIESQQVSGWPLEMGRDVRFKTCISGMGMYFPRKLSPIEKPVSTCPRSSQVVNRGRVSKYNNYYQFIMEAEGMKNHDVHIMHAQQTLSPVSYTQGFAMENLQLDLEHIIAMNSLSSSMISSPFQFIINLICSTFSPVIEPGLNSICNFPCQSSLFKTFPPVHLLDTLRIEFTLVVPWRPLRVQGKACREAKLQGLSPKGTGIHSHLRQTFPKT
jgi:hypothetical protein